MAVLLMPFKKEIFNTLYITLFTKNCMNLLMFFLSLSTTLKQTLLRKKSTRDAAEETTSEALDETATEDAVKFH